MSQALLAFNQAISEISDLPMTLTSFNKKKHAAPLKALRAAGRGRVMLTSSHFERYVYAVNEEAVSYLNRTNVPANRLPTILKLLHSSEQIENLGTTQWENRERSLSSFIASDGWLWSQSGNGELFHNRLLTWMKAPNSKNLVRYYRYWGIDDIFTTITRNKISRGRLFYGIQALVDLRNDIAHGDYNAQATKLDTLRYMKSAKKFCERADRVLAKTLANLTGNPPPW